MADHSSYVEIRFHCTTLKFLDGWAGGERYVNSLGRPQRLESRAERKANKSAPSMKKAPGVDAKGDEGTAETPPGAARVDTYL